jgi:hypothetical protein
MAAMKAMKATKAKKKATHYLIGAVGGLAGRSICASDAQPCASDAQATNRHTATHRQAAMKSRSGLHKSDARVSMTKKKYPVLFSKNK